MIFLVHLSVVIENADEPVRLIASFPDFGWPQPSSRNPLDMLEPLRRPPKSYDVTVVPSRDSDQPSEADSAFPCPAAGATNPTTAKAAATSAHRVRFIRFLSAAEQQRRLPRDET